MMRDYLRAKNSDRGATYRVENRFRVGLVGVSFDQLHGPGQLLCRSNKLVIG